MYQRRGNHWGWQVGGTVIGLALVAAGLLKLLGIGPATAAFVEAGYPDWARALAGLLQFGGGLVLLLPRFSGLGVGVFAVSLLGGALMHAISGQAARGVLPAALLVPVGLAGMIWGRHLLRMVRWRAALDAFAERELAVRSVMPSRRAGPAVSRQCPPQE